MVLAKGVILGVSALAGLAALAFSGSSHASESAAPKPAASGSPPVAIPPAAVLAEIADALASADPAHMRVAANDVEAKGFPTQAADLRATANSVEAAIRAVQPAKSPGQPQPSGVSQSTVPPPIQAMIAAALATANPGQLRATADQLDTAGFHVDAERLRQAAAAIEQGNQHVADANAGAPPNPSGALAHQVALNIAMSTKGNENKDLVLAYETQEKQRGFYSGVLDGLYGAKAALSLALDHDIIPPKPLYWPLNPEPAKNQYRQAILKKAATDPARAEAWARAANV